MTSRRQVIGCQRTSRLDSVYCVMRHQLPIFGSGVSGKLLVSVRAAVVGSLQLIGNVKAMQRLEIYDSFEDKN